MPFLKRAFLQLSFCVGLIRLEDIRSFSCRQCFRLLLATSYAWRCGCGPEICVAVDQFANPDHDFVIAFDKFPVIIKVC